MPADIAADFVNVGPDPELEGRIVRQAGVSGADDDWPMAFWKGDCIGGVEDLARFVEQAPLQPPSPPLEAGEGAGEAAETPEEGRRRLLLAEQLRSARATAPVPAQAEEPLEESMNVLNMHLSVLGKQFPDRPVFGAASEFDFDDGDSSHFGSNNNSNNAGDAAAGGAAGGAAAGDPQSPLRTVDLALEGLEWAVLKGATWLQGFVAAPSPIEPDAPRHPDFEVVQSNWYGRQQKRLLRVTSTHVQRVHPMTGEVRHAVAFGDLVALGVSRDGHTLQVMCRGDTEREVVTDTYNTVYSKQIVDSIKKRHPKVQVVVVAQ